MAGSPMTHKVLLAALLCAAIAAASSLPGSSASAPSLVSRTCARTSDQPICVSLLQSSNLSRDAKTVRELAPVAVTAARRSALRARMRAFELSYYGARGTATPAARLALRCKALYSECHRAAALALARVTNMPAYGYDERAGDAVSALRVFPERCARLFDARKVASPLVQVSREVDEKLRIASEIVGLLR